MTKSADKGKRNAEELLPVKSVSGAIGSVVGSLAGFALSGPAGAVAGGAAGSAMTPLIERVLQSVQEEFAHRFLGRRQAVRVATTLDYASDTIQRNLARGQVPRQDGFFQPEIDDRSGAEEIFEAALLAAQGEHQEKKLRLYANLVANIAFDDAIDRGQGNLLLSLGQELSYQQLCLLALFGRRQSYRLDEDEFKVHVRGFTTEQWAIMHDLYGLETRGLLRADIQGNGLYAPPVLASKLDLTQMRVYGVVMQLGRLMEFDGIADADLTRLAEQMRRPYSGVGY